MDLKLGKLPARPGSVSFKLTDYLVKLPVPPKTYGHQNLVNLWGMLGNDKYGDCVLAGAAHETMLWNAEAMKAVTFSDNNVLSDYSAITGFDPNNPNTDNGTDMQTAASYRRKTGIVSRDNTRHKIDAYLSIDIGNTKQLQTALYLFSATGVGIAITSCAMKQFKQGKPWTVTSNCSMLGYHYVPAIAYDSSYVYVVTWGKLQKMAWGYYTKYNDESIAYLSAEFLTGGRSLEGFDLSALRTDLAALNPLGTIYTGSSSFGMPT
jgi:hypothetical protein